MDGQEELGRGLAILTLRPIAERLADERAFVDERESRRRQLEAELAAVPEVPRPNPPGIWTPFWQTHELKEILLGWAIFGIPAAIVSIVVIGEFIDHTAAVILGVICGVAIVTSRTVYEETNRWRRATEARSIYARELQLFDTREAERAAIRAKFDRDDGD